MKKTLSYLCVICLFIWSCSSDSPETTNSLPDFTVVGQNEGTFYQLNFDAFNKETSVLNLTEELGLPFSNAQDIVFSGPIVSFYSRENSGFSAWQKNLTTRVSKKFESYFENNESQFAVFSTHSPNQIFVGYESPIGSGQLNMKIINRATETATDVFLITATMASLVGRPMYHNGKLLISYNDDGTYKTMVFNTQTQVVDATITYQGLPNVIRNTNGNLSVFDNGNTYFEYDLNALVKLNTRSLGAAPVFLNFGNIEDSKVHNNIVYHKSPAAQPNFLNFYPGVYDINTQDSNIIDVNQNIDISFGPLEGTRFIPLTSVFDIVNEMYLVGFRSDNSDGVKGVMIFDRNRKLLNAIEVPFSPLKIIVN